MRIQARRFQVIRRLLATAGVATALMAIMVLATIPVAGQGPAAAAKTSGTASKAYTAPRTPDGQPDLQGFWTNGTYTPLERPDGITKEFYTKEEATKIEKDAAAFEGDEAEPGTVADVHYDRTQFGVDRSLAGFASNMRTSLIVDPPNGKLPPLSAEGQRRAAERAAARKGTGIWDAAQTAPFGARCLILDHSGPPMLSGNYNNGYQFVQSPGYVTILVEMVHHARIIPIDGRSRMPGAVRQWTGSSRGRWEGETLVVETANFNGKYPIRGSSEQIRLSERFTRVDADTIRYQFTVDDPATWTKPWSAEMPMRKITGPIFEHACHEGNYDLRNLLTTARVLEKKAADEAAKKGSR
jgi:hypothetical protein